MSSSEDINDRTAGLLARREQLTEELLDLPYDLILYLERAVIYADLGYPDLAAGDAYRALLLADEACNEAFEYHEQAADCLRTHVEGPLPDVLLHGDLAKETSGTQNGSGPDSHRGLAALASIRSFQILSLSLLLCGCLKSALDFCNRGLHAAPSNAELLGTQGYIHTVARRRLRTDQIDINELPDNGVVRREVYPWNTFEPQRFSDESLSYLNAHLATMAPKCEVRVSELPVLLEGESETDNYEIIPTCKQLGLFAKEDIGPGETVLDEYTVVTANNRLKDSVCDACSTELPPLGSTTQTTSCPECYDIVFCNEYCLEKAQELYHPAVCDKPVDSIAKDPDAQNADQSLYLLLLARILAMSAHHEIHPLDVKEVKYIWGDFVPSRSNEISLAPNAGPPPEWTLPFSFKFNIEAPLHILEKMDTDIYRTLPHHDLWVLNTLFAKFRGTASARKSIKDGRPDVAAVHPFWCLANHDCNPNVSWEWGGRMRLWARETRVVGNAPGGIKSGEEILNHYCDIDLPVQQRREWARGSLGGWCMCARCREESAGGGKT